jgi:hypothetical protein
LAALLAQRIESTLTHITLLLQHPGLNCDPGWASILSGSLKDLQSNMKLSSLSVRALKQTCLMSTRSLSATSFGPTSTRAGTPPTTMDSTPIEDLGMGNSSTLAGIEWLDTGPRSSTPTKLPTPPSIQFQDADLFDLIPTSTTVIGNQELFSPSSNFPCGNTFTVAESPHLSTTYTSPGNGFSNPRLPDPLPNLQVLGMFYNVPSEIEQCPSHVSGPLSQAFDTREETSVLASRDLFPDMQYTFIG